jgi:AraC family transcriptional regulator
MEPTIVRKEAFTAVGLLYHGRNEQGEIPELWRRFGPKMDQIENTVNDCVAYGLCDNGDESTGEFDYLAAVEVGGGDVPEGMVRWDVPAATYAVFSTTLTMVKDTFDRVYHTWLPQSRYRRGPGPDLEVYGCEFDASDPLSPFDVYVPIVEE